MPGQNHGWHQPQQQFQPPQHNGLRVGLVVLVCVLALACSGGVVVKAVDRVLTGINKGDFLRIATGGSLALGALTLLVGAFMVVIGTAASRFVVSAAAVLYVIAFLLRSLHGSLDGELLAALVGVLAAAAITWTPPLAAYFQAKKAPPPGWGPPPPPPGYGHQPYGPPRTR